jgi:hypothetical protein
MELASFREHLSKAFALIHPTNADISPLTLIEAGYFVSPSISVDDFTLREVTCPSNHQLLLLRRPLTSHSIGGAVLRLLADDTLYQTARREARQFVVSNLSQSVFKARIQQTLENTFSMF